MEPRPQVTAVDLSQVPPKIPRPSSPFGVKTKVPVGISYGSGTYERSLEPIWEPNKEAEDSGLVEEEEQQPEEKINDEKKHVQLLYKFLGQELAEHFLFPTYEDPAISVQPGSLVLAEEGPKAADYWRRLREKSQRQLMQEVNKLPERLRSSGFSQLPPSHLQESIWRFRRTLGLMCRASESNQEKAMLIMTNNPLPDLNIWQQKDSSLGYLCKAPSQRKKVSDQEKPFHLPPLKMSQTQPSGTKNSRSIQTPSTGKKNYRFGNDEFFKSNGEYTKRCNTRKEQIQWALPKSTYQHMLRMTSDDKQAARGSTQAPAGRRLSWAPLTLAALMDSSRAVTVPGEGSFRHGQSLDGC